MKIPIHPGYSYAASSEEIERRVTSRIFEELPETNIDEKLNKIRQELNKPENQAESKAVNGLESDGEAL